MNWGKKIFGILLASLLVLGQAGFLFADVPPTAKEKSAAAPAAKQKSTESTGTSKIWPAWVKLGGKAGDHRQLGLLDIFVPVMQSDKDLWFIDAREKDVSGSENEWNVGAGYRRMINDNLILGVYGFFDYLRSEHGNNFMQGMLGFEALTKNLDFRLNAYIPEAKTGYTGDDKVIVNGNSINLATGIEKALPGFDAEFGFRIPKIKPDIRMFVGGFYFDRSDVPQITGPRVRTEWRLNDLFGLKGTRLTLEGEYTYDNVRQSKGYGGASVRIPFGFGFNPKTSTLNKDSLEARMIEPIIRDVDVVTSSKQRTEAAINPLTGQPYSGIWYADRANDGVGTLEDPATLGNAVLWAGDNGVIAALDSDGTIDLFGSTASLSDGQTVIGSGGALKVLGPRGLVSFTIPGIGDGTTVTADSDTTVFYLGNNNLVSDISIEGGYDGIVADGDGVGKVQLNNVSIRDTNNYGAHLQNTGDILIEGSSFDNNDYRGLAIYRSGDVTIRNTTANENDGRGINIRRAGNVTLDNVEANDSRYSLGIKIYDAEGDVNLNNVTAERNSDTNLSIEDVEGDLNISSSSFSDSEDGYGIIAEDVIGDVTLDNVNADRNSDDNIYIGMVGYDYNLSENTGGNVLIKNTSANDSDNGEGIYIYNVYSNSSDGSKGNVTLNNVIADYNSGSNLYITGIDNNVSIDPSSFSYSDYRGMEIYGVNGTVSLEDVTANGNDGRNISIESVGDIVFNKVNANDSQYSYGIHIGDVYNDVRLTDVTANGNDNTNLYIGGVGGNVSIDPSNFNNSNEGDGIYINQATNVTLEDVTATDNYKMGAHLVYVDNVDINNSHFDDNGYGYAGSGSIGLDIYDAGDVNITNSTFDNNYGRNLSILGAGDVTLNNITANNSDNKLGIRIYNANSASLKDVTASNNNDSNLSISNVGSVEIEDSYFNNSEDGNGIDIDNVMGNVDIRNVTADNNYDDNLYINNVAPADTIDGIVTINSSSFNNSGDGSGIEIYNANGVNLDNVNANNNDDYGARLQGVGDVDVNNSHFDYNDNRGLEVRNSSGDGDVTISNTIANANDSSNILVGGVNSLAISDTNADNSDNGYGLRIGYVAGDATFRNVNGINNNLDNYNTSSTITDLGGNNVPGIIVSP